MCFSFCYLLPLLHFSIKVLFHIHNFLALTQGTAPKSENFKPSGIGRVSPFCSNKGLVLLIKLASLSLRKVIVKNKSNILKHISYFNTE